MNWSTMVDGLASCAGRGAWSTPHPKGVYVKGQPVEGSCTHVVLNFLRSTAGRRSTLRRIAYDTDLPPKRISWSLYYLRSHGLVCSQEVEPGIFEWWASAPADLASSKTPTQGSKR